MGRWFLHLIAICGGILAVYGAGVIGNLANQEVPHLVWQYIDLTSACWVIAGFCLLVPAIWAERRRRRRRRADWETLLLYLVVGLILACALPLAWATQKLNLPWLTAALQWMYDMKMPVLGAILIGAGFAHAFGPQSR